MKNSYQEGTAFPPHGQMPVGHVVGRGRASAQNKQAECVQSKERRASEPQTPGHHKQQWRVSHPFVSSINGAA